MSHKARHHYLLKLADLIVTEHPQETADLYGKVVIDMVGEANNRAYQEATDLLIELDKLLIKNDKSPINSIIQNLIYKHKAKRNMMKLLKKHFAHCF